MRPLSALLFSVLSPSAALAQAPCLTPGPSQSLAGLGQSACLVAADLDGDGRIDLVSASPAASEVVLRYGQPDGTLSAPLAIPLSRPPEGRALAAGDLDGDGDVDLVVGHKRIVLVGLLSVLLQGPSGTWTLVEYPLDTFTFVGISLGDVDLDGDLDVVAIDISMDRLAVFANDGTGVLSAPTTGAAAVWSTRLALADLDGDLAPEAWMVGIGDAFGPPPSFVLSRNSGSGGFTPDPPVVHASGRLLAVGDLDGDDDSDLVLLERTHAGLAHVQLNTAGVLGAPVAFAFEPNAYDLLAFDLDLDGDLDLIAVSRAGVRVAWNDGGGSFTLAPRIPLLDSLHVAAGDFDGDGLPDLALGRGYPTITTLTLLRGDCETVADSFCLGDGGGEPCPCANELPLGTLAGCLHSFGQGAWLARTGEASLSADTLRLFVNNMPPSALGVAIQGTAAAAGGAGVPFGDGLLCLDGTIVRLGPVQASGGTALMPQGGAPLSVRGSVLLPGERRYQIWFRNPQAFCTPAGFNLSNGLRVTWLP